MTNIYVGNLSYDTSSNELESTFAAFGEVSRASVISDQMTGRSKGFGFVEMPIDSEAEAAINALNDQDLQGRRLTVNVARPRAERSRR